MKLQIVSPENTLFNGEVNMVELPGVAGRFEILKNHAAIVSSLAAGDVVYDDGKERNSVHISSGFVEVNNNVISVCVEL